MGPGRVLVLTTVAAMLTDLGAACGGDTGSDSSGSGGGDACLALEYAYLDALAQAKQCSRFPGTWDCSVSFANGLYCASCNTFVDSANTDHIAELQNIAQQWKAFDCAAILHPTCDAGICWPAPSATCEAGGQGGDVGICVDAKGGPPDY